MPSGPNCPPLLRSAPLLSVDAVFGAGSRRERLANRSQKYKYYVIPVVLLYEASSGIACLPQKFRKIVMNFVRKSSLFVYLVSYPNNITVLGAHYSSFSHPGADRPISGRRCSIEPINRPTLARY